jgi:hypothetical protein
LRTFAGNAAHLAALFRTQNRCALLLEMLSILVRIPDGKPLCTFPGNAPRKIEHLFYPVPD